VLDLTLRIDRDSTTYTYTNDRLRVRDLGVLRSLEKRTVSLADVEVQIGPTENGEPELVGITDPYALPSGQQWRAELQAGDEVALNGALRSSDTAFDQHTQCWVLQLFEEAQSDFWGILDQYFWQELVGRYPRPLLERAAATS
jgi:hypothetical protein